ncbi:UDP-2,4-diacetamido-2,4,6-trideoxy-beta-L-altropyranose hydrolase [Shewanella goraebulensis]|uniref:UDP-2,4-diacetamido-2,4, 6-trideoxy-beta-L-altropyranose hydrolase n=1 Tax=Shewanella goraebulensis TaxID=3050637 RepID=UPI00254EB6CA|nr:UDP-2,4-diacetamido-2,4,6-trideoxy-beta-L-altropyranose hydrolase [Shewanella goraebulensis]
MIKVVFRVDASIHIGNGHTMRCLVLAEALQCHGYQIEFVSRDLEGNLNEYITSKGFQLIVLPAINPVVSPQTDADYLAWLQCSQLEDAVDFLETIKHADIVVTDHYAIEFLWQQKVRDCLNCKIIAIDDLTRHHCADMVIDQSLGRQPNEYFDVNIALMGSRYALLAPEFTKLRNSALQREKPNERGRVLVSMGGVDAPNATLAVLKQLMLLKNISVTVLLSKKSPSYISVANFCQKYLNILHIDFSENMAQLMMEHDVSIGAAGTTSWERACLGLPSIMIPLAENQLNICDQIVASGCGYKIQLNDISSELILKYETLRFNWKMLYQNNLLICDGNGAHRVVREILRLV